MPTISISLSKCPILHIIALFFILAISEAIIIFLLPVAVTNISIWSITYSLVTTRYPSMQAYKAQIGSHSATYTIAF